MLFRSVPDEEVPLAVVEEDDLVDLDEEQDENEREIEQIEDEEVPLVNVDSGMSQSHRILHYTELILAAVMGGAYIGSTRKQKKEISALKKRRDDEER